MARLREENKVGKQELGDCSLRLGGEQCSLAILSEDLWRQDRPFQSEVEVRDTALFL